jgi:hypothetical protein
MEELINLEQEIASEMRSLVKRAVMALPIRPLDALRHLARYMVLDQQHDDVLAKLNALSEFGPTYAISN